MSLTFGRPVRVWSTVPNSLRCTVVVVGYDGVDWLPPLFRTLIKSMENSDAILTVDNGGNHGGIPLSLGKVRQQVVETPTRMGFCAANNFGLEKTVAKSEFIGFLNQDVVVDEKWLSSIHEIFMKNPRVGALSAAHLTYHFNRLNPNFRSSIRHDRRCMSRRVNEQGWFQQDNLIAAAMVVRTSVLAEVGGFDPIFGSYCEDYDLCRRIREAGYKTGVVPASRIGHFDGSATRTRRAELKRERQVVRNWAIHRIRSSKTRLQTTIKEVCWGMPKRLVKSLIRRPDSQHPSSVLRAWASLISLTPRLFSKKRDDRITQSHFIALKANLKSAKPITDAWGES